MLHATAEFNKRALKARRCGMYVLVSASDTHIDIFIATETAKLNSSETWYHELPCNTKHGRKMELDAILRKIDNFIEIHK